jgi:hypothetical protein
METIWKVAGQVNEGKELYRINNGIHITAEELKKLEMLQPETN